jgi:hypothetical protein
MNDLWFAKMSSFSKLVFLEGIPEFLEIPNSSYCSFGVNQQSFTSFLFLIYQTLFLVVFWIFSCCLSVWN